MASSRIFAIVTIYDTPELLPHFLAHYKRLGVHRILVITNIELPNEGELTSAFPVTIARASYSRFHNTDKDGGEARMLAEAGATSHDWVLHLDLDEFHQYPCHLHDLVRLASLKSIRAIEGTFLDRISDDGTLREIQEGVSLSQQLPLGGRLTKVLIKGDDKKVMLTRNDVRLVHGRHKTADGTKTEYPCGNRESYQVHHFRWVKPLIDRLEQRFRDSEVNEHRRTTAFTNLAFCDEYRRLGRIDLANLELQTRYCGDLKYPTYSNIAAAEELEKYAQIMASRAYPNPWQIDDTDVYHLEKVARRIQAKRILEFGPGRSTLLWLILGCEVDTLEYDDTRMADLSGQLEHLPGVRLYRHGRPIRVTLPLQRYDLAFVDGPGAIRYRDHCRLDAIMFALKRADCVLLHDSKRRGEAQSLRALKTMGHRVESIETPRGIAIIWPLQDDNASF